MRMHPPERASARRQLDKRLQPLRGSDALTRPPRGWIKAVREALGMTTAQLAGRLGVSQPRVVAIEHAEQSGAITLQSLEKTARALDCRLVYALVPRTPLEQYAEERARVVAKRILGRASHSMALEAQRVEADDEKDQVEKLARRLLDKPGSALWDEQ